jgi:transglutaminase-like putative cysteine protease
MNPSAPTQLLLDPIQDPSAIATAPEGVRMQVDCSLAYALDGDCEFVFLIQAAMGTDQTLVEEELLLQPPLPYRTYTDERSGNRFLRLRADAGVLELHYHAVVDRAADRIDLAAPELPVHALPDELLHFMLPTRYCESDLLGPVAQQLFGALPGGHARVSAICDWVHQHIDYRIGSTTATTTARDVFVQRSGVCRDFAHLALTFCRGLNIPARLVSAYAHFDEPPPDFHAVFEAYLGGRWMMFDPSRMAPVHQLVRLATGRDAKDVAFATIYGPARMVSMSPVLNVLAPGAARAGAMPHAPALPG